MLYRPVRKNLLIAGIILLVVGVVFVGTSLSLEDTSLHTSSILNFNSSTNEYYSSEINLNPSNELIVVSGDKYYLIPSSDLAISNSTNYVSFQIPPTTSFDGNQIYSALNGSYYLVSFASSPSISYAVTSTHSISIVYLGFLLLVGIALFISGIVISITGAMLKPKARTWEVK
jgi:hypothetical protein